MRERKEALAKFRESLSRPMTERFYEEDELIDFFDFASDFNDEYLRIEALMCAARLYPNSEEMLQRKAIFYSEYSGEAIEKYLEDNQQSMGAIWDIARARVASPQSPETQREVLDNILSSYNELTDEDIIQLIDLATSYSQLKWLKDNLSRIEEKAIYPSSVLYETAISAELQKDSGYAVELLERLTDIEPFNADFWRVLSKEYIQVRDFDKAFSALEYAIAIEPENPENLYMKAQLLFMTGGSAGEILFLSNKVEELDGMNRELLKITGLINQSTGENQRTIDAYERFIHQHPEQEKEALLDMFTLFPHDADKILDRINNLDGDLTIWNWLEWAESFVEMGALAQAEAVISMICRNPEQLEVPFSLVELSFRLGLFKSAEILAERFYISRLHNDNMSETESMIREGGTEFENEEIDRTFYLITIMTKLKLGKHDEAKRLAMEVNRKDLSHFPESTSSKIFFLGFYGILEHIIRRLTQSTDNDNWEEFDPFGYWNNKT